MTVPRVAQRPGVGPRQPVMPRPARLLISTVSCFAWIGTATAVALAAFSYLLPQDLSATGRAYAWLATVAFYGRVLTFQTGLALAAAAAWAAVARRRWLLTVAAVATVACLGPTLYAARPHAAPPATGTPLRVMSVNLMYDNHDHAAVIAAVRAADADVVAFEEYTVTWDAALQPALSAAYPYRCAEPRHFAAGLALFSKRPFVEPPRSAIFDDHARVQIRAVVAVDGQPLALYAVHPLAPHLAHSVIVNRHQTLDLIAQVRAERGPTVLFGDWNFTAETPNAVALNAAGLTDAYDQANPGGRGSTWPVYPRWKSWLPGVRIDHVYLSPGLACARYATGAFDGSDHLPIVADVAVPKR